MDQAELNIIKYGRLNGKTREEVVEAINKYHANKLNAPTSTVFNPNEGLASETPEEPGFISRVGDKIEQRGVNVFEEITGSSDKRTSENPLVRGFKAVANAFGGIGDVAIEGIKSIPGAEAVGEAVMPTLQKGFSKIVDYSSPIGQKLYEFEQRDPEKAKAVTDFLEVAAASGEIAGNILLADTAAKAATGVKNLAVKTEQKAAETLKNTFNNAYDSAQSVQARAKTYLAGKSVNPQLKDSADRLFMDGTQRVKDPVGLYDDYVKQSKAALTDIKADPAISRVGEDIGKAFEKVVKQRQIIGKQMGAELEKVGNIKLNIIDTADDLAKELQRNGIKILQGKEGITLGLTDAAKITKADLRILNEFYDDVAKLGNNPTLRQVDALISRTQGNLDLFKGSSNIFGTTNGERIIKGTLKGFRDKFSPKINPAFADYAEARGIYSELSDFVKDGTRFLGKRSASGDFVRDASLAKSSVQSILNNGKKDWLVRLEGYTGEPVLDKSVLALQAMKDVGDFRGLSLLQSFSNGGVPHNARGIVQKVLEYGVDKGTKAIVGTPEEQTRMFLQSLGATDDVVKGAINSVDDVTKAATGSLDDVTKAAAGSVDDAVKPLAGDKGFINFGAIKDSVLGKSKTVKLPRDINVAAQTFTREPQSFTLFRGENAANKGGLHFYLESAPTKTFGKDMISGTLPKGSKIKILSAVDKQAGIAQGIYEEKGLWDMLFKQGYDAVVGADAMNSKMLDIIVNPKHLGRFK